IITFIVLSLLFLLLILTSNEVIYNSSNARTSAVLRCPYISVAPMILTVWNKSTKNGMGCLLAYRADTNETKSVNCSERMTWESRPDYDPSLQIHPVKLADEGTYMCEVVNSDGSFYNTYALTVLVPPEVTLTYGSGGIALCRASAGKPAAHVSWVPQNGHSIENKVHHLNGTVTTVSRMYWINSTAINKRCLITHPTTNRTLSIDLSPSEYQFLNLCIRLVQITLYLSIQMSAKQMIRWYQTTFPCSRKGLWGKALSKELYLNDS
uniref:Ig-like domain-containing protein n=1 Tax=Crocodylus porosus TaxID=8502 RepID=A0A7M4EZD9_CROPO